MPSGGTPRIASRDPYVWCSSRNDTGEGIFATAQASLMQRNWSDLAHGTRMVLPERPALPASPSSKGK
jgi:hypothetical protein